MGGKGWCVRGRGEEGSGGCDRDEMEGEGWGVRGRGEEGSGGCDRDEMEGEGWGVRWMGWDGREGEGEKHKMEAMMEGGCLCEGSYTKEMHSGRG